VLDDLHTGKLDLGMFKNWLNSGQNMAGISDEQSRAFARYQQFLQKVANDNLLLNKGVQTEGDAYREMKAIGAAWSELRQRSREGSAEEAHRTRTGSCDAARTIRP
jgi:hypothetical protein